MIADEPEARDRVELLKFASSRLGGKVIEAEGVGLAFGSKVLLGDGLAHRPGRPDRAGRRERLGQVVAHARAGGGAGADAGTVERGETVRLAHLSQDTAEIPGELRVLEAVEEVRGYARLGDGSELTAGLPGRALRLQGREQRTLVKDLSGGERRRLQLMRLLMSEPNVLLLDEPTNDLDIDTLTALEDLLDGWPGTLIVVSHDRYFVERVCDNVYALSARLRHPPAGGIEQYLTLRRRRPRRRVAGAPSRTSPSSAPRAKKPRGSNGRSRSWRARGGLHAAMAARRRTTAACGSSRTRSVENAAERERLEAEWLEAAERAG